MKSALLRPAVCGLQNSGVRLVGIWISFHPVGKLGEIWLKESFFVAPLLKVKVQRINRCRELQFP